MYQSNFLTVEEVADNLKVTRQTVSKYIRSSELNAVKINKSYRITFKDFESFLNKNSTAEEPQIAYLRKTKNCFLEYSDKSDEFEVLYAIIVFLLIKLTFLGFSLFAKKIIKDAV